MFSLAEKLSLLALTQQYQSNVVLAKDAVSKAAKTHLKLIKVQKVSSRCVELIRFLSERVHDSVVDCNMTIHLCNRKLPCVMHEAPNVTVTLRTVYCDKVGRELFH